MPLLWPGRGGPACDYISAPPGSAFQKKFPRNLAILGSTGSIGRNALELAAGSSDQLRVFALAGGRNYELLARQAMRFQPKLLAVQDEGAKQALLELLPMYDSSHVLVGEEGFARLASHTGADIVLSAQAGASGLPGTLAALLSGKVVALANKESLVLAGRICRAVCDRAGAAILPVDSEHFALFQCMCGRGQTVSRLVLTASGGPFRNTPSSELKNVSARQAMAHPNWNMGAKITIDSATLMNKGLEILEAMHLFGVPANAIQTLVQPQSIVHSLVQFKDNGMLAQLGAPDMKLPIASCLLWPRVPEPVVPPPDLAAIGKLEFFEPDMERFPCLGIAKTIAEAESQREGMGISAACVVMNAANEEAVSLFRAGKIGFCDIPFAIRKALDHFGQLSDLEEINYLDQADPADEAVRLTRLIRIKEAETRAFVNSL